MDFNTLKTAVAAQFKAMTPEACSGLIWTRTNCGPCTLIPFLQVQTRSTKNAGSTTAGAATAAAKRAKLRELIENKAEQALQGKSVEELQAELAALGG